MQSTRLTLLLHPGRIKRGVGPRERLGPVLRSGQRVRLRLDGSLKSRRRVPLGEAFEQSYRVTLADRTTPDPDRWQVEAPRAPHAPLTIRFEEALDRGQLSSFAQILGRNEEPLPGVATVAADGRSWSFLPTAGWRSGSYRILARRDVEDLAGNRPDRLFDVETVVASGTEELVAKVTSLRAQHRPLLFHFEVSFDP